MLMVQIAVVQEDEEWFVDVYVNGAHYHRLEADSREEARAMHADILKIVQESGGTVAWLHDWHARRN